MASFSKNGVGILAATVGIASVFGGLLFKSRQVEHATRNRERLLRDLMDNAADAFFVHDLNGKIVGCNRTAYESLGYSPEELLTLSFEDIEEGLPLVRMRRLWEGMEPGSPLEIEGVQRRKARHVPRRGPCRAFGARRGEAYVRRRPGYYKAQKG